MHVTASAALDMKSTAGGAGYGGCAAERGCTQPCKCSPQLQQRCKPFAEWASKDRYRELLQERRLPVLYPEQVTDWSSIGFAVAWKPPPGLLAECPNLLAAMSLGAGVDHILQPGQVRVLCRSHVHCFVGWMPGRITHRAHRHDRSQRAGPTC